MVPAYRAARYQLSEHHPESSAARGRLLRQEIDRFESILGQPLTTGVVRHFFPDIEVRCGVTPDWAVERIESLRAGRGCVSRTWARLVPLFWRLPALGWSMAMPIPPKDVAVYWLPGWRYGVRNDGSVIEFPPLSGREAA